LSTSYIFHALKIDVHWTWTVFYSHIRDWCDIPCHSRSGWRLQKTFQTFEAKRSILFQNRFTCKERIRRKKMKKF
jgi:hypothetical protein